MPKTGTEQLYATKYGFSPEDLQALSKAKDFTDLMNKSIESQRASLPFGDPFKDSHDFMNAWSDVWMRLSNLAEGSEIRMMKSLTGPMQWTDQWLQKHESKINDFSAWFFAGMRPTQGEREAYERESAHMGYSRESMLANEREMQHMGFPPSLLAPDRGAPMGLTVNGAPVSASNPLPVKPEQPFGDLSGISKGVFGGGGGGGGGASPVDKRNWWQRVAPGWLGGKPAPVAAAGSLTLTKLAGYKQVFDAAKAAGDPHPDVTAAQWANESAWGTKPSGKNNFFGQTRAGVPGDWMDYDSPEAGLADHLRRWSGKPGYAEAKTPQEAIAALVAAGYTPDQGYADAVERARKQGESGRLALLAQTSAAAADNTNIPDISGASTYARKGETLSNIKGFIVHDTEGGGSPEDVINTLNKRGLGVQYIMDHDGKIYKSLPDGSRGAHILPSEINDLSNDNTEGMEIIANDNADITPAQVKSAVAFLKKFVADHPGVQIFGHGEVNPSHKKATEGKAVVDAFRAAMAEQPTIVSSTQAFVPLAKRTLMAFANGSIDSAQAAPGTFKSPFGDLIHNLYGSFSHSLGGGDVDNSTTHNYGDVSVKNEFHIDGSGDPQTTAAMVGLHIERTSSDWTRNLQGAAQ